jgi:cutinase
MIAALVGSTNESFEEMLKQAGGKQPKQKGGATTGKSCITKYFKELGLGAPEGFKGGRFTLPSSSVTGVVSPVAPVFELDTSDFSVSEVKPSHPVPEASRITPRQGCKPNIFMFARGTTEAGTMGSTVGPAVSRALGSSFSSVGISYSADLNGIYCIGLPGGVRCIDQLAKMVAKCPTSNIFLGGYSQGAMVVRICVAHSKEDVKKRVKVSTRSYSRFLFILKPVLGAYYCIDLLMFVVKPQGVLTYGDPFNGASVKGLPMDAVKVFCSATDGVCKGEFSITAGHLGYVGTTTGSGAKWLLSRASGKGEK